MKHSNFKKQDFFFLGIFFLFVSLHADNRTRSTVKKAAKQIRPEFIFDQEQKQKDVVALVERGVEFINENRLSDAGRAFTHTKDFVEGELYLFIFDMQGIVIAHGQQDYLLWDNMYNYKDDFGAPMVQKIINKAKDGGGWVTYEWRGAVKQSYVKKITKEGKDYAIGSGYYSHSKEDAAIGLVKGAVAMFGEVMVLGQPPEVAFSIISYPMSTRFVRGDLYLYAMDFNGLLRAHGDRPGLIGSNSLDYKDSKGKLINREIIKKLKDTDAGVWIEYTSKNAPKKSYTQKVTDVKGVNYFIACGYYPDADRDAVVDLVRKGYQFMKASGKSAAVKAFSDKRNNDFRYGDLWLEVYTTKGLCIAHGDNDELIGKNLWDQKDEDGRYFISEYVETAQDGRGWVNVKLNNSFMTAYVEKIDLGLEEFIITAGTYPVSKAEVTELLVKSTIGLMETSQKEDTFRAVSDRNGNFIRGDLSVFIFDQEGLCYAYGDEYDLIWKNLLDMKDDNGKPFVQIMINTSAQGAGYVTFIKNKHEHRAFVERIEKNGTSYTVGSGFYM